jgi:hypothetical protein
LGEGEYLFRMERRSNTSPGRAMKTLLCPILLLLLTVATSASDQAVEVQKLLPSDGIAHMTFGGGVATEGDTLVVGAPYSAHQGLALRLWQQPDQRLDGGLPALTPYHSIVRNLHVVAEIARARYLPVSPAECRLCYSALT